MDDESNKDTEDFDLNTRLALEFDPRLADVWLSIFSLDLEPDDLVRQIGLFLRMAYLRGYDDALKEGKRGELYLRLGVPVPPTPAESRPIPRTRKARPRGGSR